MRSCQNLHFDKYVALMVWHYEDMHGAVRFIWLLTACSAQRGYRLIFRDLWPWKTTGFCAKPGCICVPNIVQICQCHRELCVIFHPDRLKTNQNTCQMQIYASDNTAKLLVAGRCSAFISIRCDTPFVRYVGLCGNKGVTSWTMCWLFFIFYIWRPRQQIYL